jgi:peptide/nickel transport system substrate-binding protein
VTRLKTKPIVALVMALALFAAACGGGGETDGGGTSQGGTDTEVQRGGVFRIETPEFGYTNGFDPTGEYLGSAFSLYSGLLVRALTGYNHVSGQAGNEVIGDLATDEGQVSEDGLTYTYTLKDGVMFGPPVDREVTSEDVKYAFERIGTESLVAQYGFYYDVIEGMAEFKAGEAKEISGIETPDDKSISFTLTEPTGDFPFRLAMPAAAPIPQEVGKCFTKAGEYGRFVISSSSYMFEGSEDLDISSCKAMKPISGFDPNKEMSLVRNPNYDPATDSPEVRSNLVDGMTITINTNIDDIFNRIQEGEIEGEIAPPPGQVLREYGTTPELEDFIKVNPGDRTWYITMNLTQPPFDDIHVRKAVNLAMDKEGLLRAWGGPVRGEIATHIIPDTMLAGLLDDYDPYATPNLAGDIEAAKEEMRQSKYDTDGDGVCDDPSCEDILHFTRNTPPYTDMVPVEDSSLEPLGITLQTREVADVYTPISDVSKAIPISSGAGWGKDYADPSTFMVLFDSSSILPTGNINYSLVGLSPEQATDIKATGTVDNIPSVDSEIDECQQLVDQERLQCWADLDKLIMEDVVPWVPYLDATNVDIISENVTQYEYDQFSGEVAYAHIAVDESAQ